MKYKRFLFGTAASVGVLILVLDSRTALAGAQEGIALCLNTVIPSLFPLLAISIWSTNALQASCLHLVKPLRVLCKAPAGTEPILLSGFLSGYPVGAKCISLAYQNGQLSRKNAEAMLAFSSNAGPAFIFGLAAPLFHHWAAGWFLWITQILSAALTARIIHPDEKAAVLSQQTSCSFSQAIQEAGSTLALICGWIILFRILLSFTDRWFLWFFPESVRILLTGALELTNGCLSLPVVENDSLRFILCSVFLAFGGLCVTLQTSSVLNGLSIKTYLVGKSLQLIFSLLISTALCAGLWPILPALLLFLCHPGKIQKKSSIQPAVGV